MKKILLSTAAFAGLALVAAAPARADEPALQLGLGGYVSGYAVYTDQDEPAGTNYRKFDFRKDTEVHLNGEVALDNGITAGAHMELLADRQDGGSTVEESYLYMSSSWGRINFGEEDGIAYLIQVAPPTADDKVDGPSPDIGTFANTVGGTLSYGQRPFAYTNKFTYITPVFNGFQAGFSFTPSPSEGDQSSTNPATISNSSAAPHAQDFKNGWELAGRYEASFDSVDVALGAGYSKAAQEAKAVGEKDLTAWNAGATVGFGAFDLGVAHVDFNTSGLKDEAVKGWVIGGDYKTGPYKLGLNYTTVKAEQGTGTRDMDIDRYTGGVVYEWGPGMTFRGAVQYQDANDFRSGATTYEDHNATQVTIGTQLNF